MLAMKSPIDKHLPSLTVLSKVLRHGQDYFGHQGELISLDFHSF